jgi:hypothetical protein
MIHHRTDDGDGGFDPKSMRGGSLAANVSSGPSSTLRLGVPLLEFLARHRQAVRIVLAGVAATRDTLDQAERSVWSTWAAQPGAPGAPGAPEVQAALLQSARTAITQQLDALAQQAIASRDPLLHLLAQGGLEKLLARAGTGDGIGAQIQARLEVMPAEDRALLHARYTDRLPNSVIARSRGWSTGRVDAQLVLAREVLDGSLIDTPPDGKEGIVPTLIEEYLVSTLDAPSRALLAERVMSDLPVAARFARQVRLDLVLTEVLSPPSDQDLHTLLDQLSPDSAQPSGAPPVRPAISSRQRTSADVGDLRKAGHVPLRRGQRRSQTLTWSIVGGLAATIAISGILLATASRTPATPGHPGVGRTEVATPSPQNRPSIHDAPPQPPPAHASGPELAAEPPLAHGPLAAPAALTPPAGPLPASPPLPEHTATPIPAPPSEPTAGIPNPAPSAVTTPVTPPPRGVSAPAAGGPAAGSTFVTGIHFGGEAVTIDGHRWLSEKQAIDEGMAIRNSRHTLATITPIPAVDAETKAMLTGGVAAARNEPLAMSLKLPNGGYEAYVYLMETLRSSSRLLDVEVGGETLAGIGDLPLGGWSKYGPCAVTVTNGTLEISAKARKGTPVLMGLALYRTAVVQTYQADFSDGTAKDWAASGGAWSCADGHYLHTSNQGVELSLYNGATWSDIRFSASMFPHFNNAYGVVFDAQDAQEYVAISVNATTATLFRMAHGVRTQIAEAPCAGSGQWKWSTIAVTQAGTSVSVSINNAPVFTSIAIGEPHSGKIGLFTDWNPVDFDKITVIATGK